MLGAWRWRWFWPRKAATREHLEVVLYTRPRCHLCEAAWELLRREQRRHHFRLAVVNVDTDAELVRQYGDQVPVVTVNGKVRFRGAINPVLWRRLLRHGG